MQFVCTMLLPKKLSEPAKKTIRENLVSRGWEKGEANDALFFSVPANPFAVDTPSVELGSMLRDLCKKESDFVECAKLSLCCRLHAYEIFTEVVTLGVCADGSAGIAPGRDVPPVFGDSIRLRDKMLSVVQRVAGKK
ncbi:hypothetical protein LJC26_08420 [Desulfovibrio sp. OttesenSCG-928-O18]|nr:hypothetical protein [Desulfovibrio sp. OttesenSCG-928-O18]